MSKTMCVFGDSIAVGNYDYEKGGWARRLNPEFKYNLLNLSIDGDDTTGLLKRMEQEARTREADVILIAIGINDTHYINEPTNMQTPFEQFNDNIRQLIKIATGITDKVAFVGFMPLEEEKLMPLPWHKEYYHTLENCEKYNYAVKEMCAENNISFIDLYNAFIKTDYGALLEDGAHPNSKGHEEMAKIIKSFLEQKDWLNKDW